MSGAPQAQTIETKPPPKRPADTSTPIPPPPQRAQGLNIVLKPGLKSQADLPTEGGTTAGGSAPPLSDAPIGVDAEAQQAAAEMMQSAQAQPDTTAGTKEAKAPAATAAEPAARTLRDVLTEQPTGQAAAAGAKPAEGAPTSVLGDIATGVMESPKALVGGVRNASEELLDSTKSVADWLNKNVGDLGGAQVFDVNGNFDPKIFSTMAEAEAQGAVAKPGKILPAVGAPRSTTGSVISNITQFLTGMAVGGKVLGAYAESAKVGKVASGFIKAAFSDAFAFDPAQYRLSNTLHDEAGLREPVTEFLRSKPGDSEVEGRLKNALEGLGVGGAMQVAFVAGLRALKAARTLGHAAEPVDPKALARALSPLGDTSKPGPIVSRAAEARTAAEAATRDVSPRQIMRGLGMKAFHGTPHEFERFDLSRIGSGEGHQAYGHGLYFAESEDIAKAYRQALTQNLENTTFKGKLVDRGDLSAQSLPWSWRHDAAAIELKGIHAVRVFSGDVAAAERSLAGAMTQKQALAAEYRSATERGQPSYKALQTEIENYGRALAWLKENAKEFVTTRIPGFVYEVKLDVSAGELLLWDKTFREQSTLVRAALEKIAGKPIDPNLSGKELYETVLRGRAGQLAEGETVGNALRDITVARDPKAAAEIGRENGIRGIRYLDAGSRGEDAKTITHNLVIFDDKDVRVTGRTTVGDKIEPVQGVPVSALKPNVTINFARIETADDVKAAMQQAANIFGSDIEKAQRGVISLAETKNLADGLGMQVDDLLSRRRANNGARTPFTAEEAVAARRLLTAAGEKLLELARTAASPNAGEVDQFNFRKMMATHYAIQQEVLGARTETARALSSWRIGAGSSEAQIKAIQAAMEAGGGTKTSKEMATALAMLDANTTTPGAVSRAVRQGTFGKTIDAIRGVYIAGLLSNPRTHVINSFSNFLSFALSVAERKVAEKIGGAVVSGEARALAYGFLQNQQEGFRLAAKTWRTGETSNLLGKVDQPHARVLSPETWEIRNNSVPGRVIDTLGRVFQTPMLALSTADQYFRTVLERAELSAQALRQATGEGLKGKALAMRAAELVEHPPESMAISSADAALYRTFNNEMGEFGNALMNLRERGGRVIPLWLVMTFVRTPANIFRYAFEHTPLAPMVGQWRADFAAGGVRRDQALSKVAIGTTIMGITQSMTEAGLITGNGPNDPGERENWLRQGNQPWSLKVGDRWYAYNRFDPLGTVIGFAATMEEVLQRKDVAPGKVDEWHEVMAGGIAAISETTLSKSFLSGTATFFETMADPERYASSYINRQTGSFLPFTALLGASSGAYDPTVRDARTPMDALVAKIPGLASGLIPLRDLWGVPVTRESGFGTAFDLLTPSQVREEVNSPIDAELERLRAFPRGIGWKDSVNGVAVNFSDYPQTLDRYRALAGNEWKHPAWGMGLKDFLDATVQGKGPLSTVYQMYSDGEQGGKQAFIRSWIQKYREGAAQALLADPKYAAFKAHWLEQQSAQRRLKQRVTVN